METVQSTETQSEPSYVLTHEEIEDQIAVYEEQFRMSSAEFLQLAQEGESS